ncbi:MAG: ABC transporter ATP-binding protein [Oscillospiraceae bacterium]|jgi:ABC-2 type transport system ATP-binding protein|nr:ABC transporter ATP-binding protein [Oscillospiraceae bacterium]
MLKIDNLTKTFGGKTAVDSLTLHVRPGELYGFIGHNGAGKSTTIKAVCGLLTFDSGEISVCGHSVKREPMEVKRSVAYLPDNPNLYEFLTGIKYLNFIADVYGVKADARRERIRKYGDLFELTGDLAQPVSAYSHGMKQKLALISALLHEPKVIIMDEPFVGLDPKASKAVKGIMRDICDAGGAIFFSTHVLEVAERLCDKIAVISRGKLVASGKMEDVLGQKSLENVFFELEADSASEAESGAGASAGAGALK